MYLGVEKLQKLFCLKNQAVMKIYETSSHSQLSDGVQNLVCQMKCLFNNSTVFLLSVEIAIYTSSKFFVLTEYIYTLTNVCVT